jgi:hypothetical protein
VLGVKHAKHKKYNNYEDALRDFYAYVGATTSTPTMVLADCGESILNQGGMSIPPQGGNSCSWKNMVIISLLVMVLGL